MAVLFLDMVEKKKLKLLRIVPGAFSWSIPLRFLYNYFTFGCYFLLLREYIYSNDELCEG